MNHPDHAADIAISFPSMNMDRTDPHAIALYLMRRELDDYILEHILRLLVESKSPLYKGYLYRAEAAIERHNG